MLSWCSSRCYRCEWSCGCSSIVWRDSNSFDVLAKTVQNDATDLELPVMVVVDGVYRGDLVVGYEELGSIPTSDIVTRVHEALWTVLESLLSALPEIMDEATAATATATTRFARLVETNFYTVTAVAMGPAGSPVAFGCAISPEIRGAKQFNRLSTSHSTHWISTENTPSQLTFI